jgi:maltose alpha-D-glucosyltransferase/alpha-amylase
MDQRALYQSMRNVVGTTLRELRFTRGLLSEFAVPLASDILEEGPGIYDLFAPLLSTRLTAKRARIHGTLDLRNILWLGKDVRIVDLEGDRTRTAPDRRRKRCPIRDVASMIRSYHRLSATVCFDPALVREDDRPFALLWSDAWADWVGAAFLAGYLEEGRDLSFLPLDPDELAMLVDLYLLEATLADLRKTLLENPSRADVALHGLHRLLARAAGLTPG